VPIASVLVALVLAAPLTATAAEPCREPPADAAIPDIGFELVADGLRNPTHVAAAFDGSGRLFVVEQRGTIRVIENGRLLPEPFLDIRARVESGGEKGLLSVAFHPRFRDNGLLFVNYTTRERALHTHVSRFRAAGRRADAASETVLLRIEQPYDNHNGGQIAFGPDGFLYIGMGDGGAANDPHDHGQNLGTLLGALLRIDVDREQPPLRYAIPPDNPFVKRAGARAEIWAYGLRNPWRFSFDAANGRLYAADVGQDAIEEIDVIRKGGNYGWRIMEGNICTPAIGRRCDTRGLEAPIHTYGRPDGYSVTGGFVYRGRALPGLCGVYVYADYVSQRIWGLRYDGRQVGAQRTLFAPDKMDKIIARLAGGGLHVSSFGEDEARELYLADHRGGRILRLVAAR
jgi:glucose/arabinose dehydrogenase